MNSLLSEEIILKCEKNTYYPSLKLSQFTVIWKIMSSHVHISLIKKF